MRALPAVVLGELLSAWRLRRTHEILVNSALAVAGFLYVGQQSIVEGLDALLQSNASSRVAIVMANGSRSESESRLSDETKRALLKLFGDQRRDGGLGDVLEEIVVSTQAAVNDEDVEVRLRGADWHAATAALAPRLRDGRLPLSGVREIALGAGMASDLGVTLGGTIALSGLDWQVVGLLDADERYSEEAITTLRAIQSTFGYGDDIQSIRIELPDSAAIDRLAASVLLSEIPRIAVRTEAEYLADLSRGSRDLVARFGDILIVFIGCLAAGVYAVGQATLAALRSSHWATYRAVGYKSLPVVIAMTMAAAATGLVAGLGGAAAGWAWFDGRAISAFFGDADMIIVQRVPVGAIARTAASMSIVSAITLLLALLPTWRPEVARHLRIADPQRPGV
jgi:putative ABC transport system permease protein